MKLSSNTASLRDLKIIFMGTPEFAVASLEAMLKAGCNIVCVITAPDKRSGRGLRLNESAVKKFSVEKGVRVLQPEKLKNEIFLKELKSLNADLQIVVAFRMLPEIVWSMPPLGTVNLHASLLPQYRGAAPINWAIINGEKETGVTTFKLKQEIDTGNILLQEKVMIGKDETAGELHDRMKIIGADLLVKTVNRLADGRLKGIAQSAISDHQSEFGNHKTENLSTVNYQPTNELKHAPKIFTDTCKIDWNKSVDEIHNLIRGLSPYPTAFCFLNNKMIKIFRSKKEQSTTNNQPSTIISDGKFFLKFACSNGFIHVLDIQLEGKKRMLTEDFLKGFRINSIE